MAKRYIDTKLWDKTWFRRLEVWQKSVWLYLITRCDHAGIIDFDSDSFNFHLKTKYGSEAYLKLFKQFEDKVVLYEENTKIWVKTFVEYQYGGLDNLNPNVRPQKAVIDRLIAQGLLDKDTMVFTVVESFALNDVSKGEKILKAYKPELLKRFDSSVDVDNEIEKMIDYIKQSGKRYKDYEAFARNWCRNNFGTKATNSKGSTKLEDFKKETGGFNIGYCYECGEHQFYDNRQVWGDSRCCKKRILPKRRDVHEKAVQEKLKSRRL
jgi:hypothetical protein|tara:strand:+ start:206 stop:1003 length:798 start_codon:yes stop_codon:yes gene_type:complete